MRLVSRPKIFDHDDKKLTNLVIVKSRILLADLTMMVLTVQDVGIGRARDLGLLLLLLGCRSMDALGIPEQVAVDDDTVGLEQLDGTKKHNSQRFRIASKHALFTSRFSSANGQYKVG